jgi:hypothetical protein
MDHLIQQPGDMNEDAIPTPRDEKPQPLTRKEASAYLRDRWGLSYCVRTLAAYAVRGIGPEYSRAGPKAMYAPAALDRWAKTKLTGPATKASELKLISEIEDDNI